jgi:CelD/BcsL family acetyltransferase involved in cellulose biosynthesis
MEWNQLLSHSLDNNPFLTYEWLTSWWKQFGKGRTLKLFTAENGNRAPSLIVPIMYSPCKRFGMKLKKAEFASTPDSDYNTFLLTNYHEATKAIIPLIKSIMEDLSDTDYFRLGDVPEDSYTAQLLQNVNMNHIGTNSSEINMCPYVTLPTDTETFLQTLSHCMRNGLKRYEKKASKDYKVEFVKYDKIGTVKEAMEVFFELHQKRQTQKGKAGVFAESDHRRFHLDIANAFAKKGWLALFFLTFNDKPVSSIYCYEYNKKLYYYLSGFDPEYATYRPGQLTFKNIIRYGIEKGLNEFDFLRGNETYKSLWGTKIRRNLEFRISKRKLITTLYDWTETSRTSPFFHGASVLSNRFSSRFRVH